MLSVFNHEGNVRAHRKLIRDLKNRNDSFFMRGL